MNQKCHQLIVNSSSFLLNIPKLGVYVYVYTYIDRHIFLILSNMFFFIKPLSLDFEDEDVSDSSSEASVNLVFDE